MLQKSFIAILLLAAVSFFIPAQEAKAHYGYYGSGYGLSLNTGFINGGFHPGYGYGRRFRRGFYGHPRRVLYRNNYWNRGFGGYGYSPYAFRRGFYGHPGFRRGFGYNSGFIGVRF